MGGRRARGGFGLGALLVLVACGGGDVTRDAGADVATLWPDVANDPGRSGPEPVEPGPDAPVDGAAEVAGCVSGATRCVDDLWREGCGDDGRWRREACQTVCEDRGQASEGCADGDCQCEDTGPCAEGATRCAGADGLETCVAGAWKASICSVTCAGEGLASLGCVEGACRCGTPPPCDAGEVRCQGPGTLARCVEGAWQARSCAALCAEEGLESAGCEGDACQCTDAPPACAEGARRCEDPDTLATCAQGTWVAAPCDEVCAAHGQVATGCQADACACTDAPFCPVGAEQCAGDATLARCTGASWSLVACAEVCAGAGQVGDRCEQGACVCEVAPDCQDGQVTCQDGVRAARCEGGAWVAEPCAATCAAAGLVGGRCEAAACACLGDQAETCAGCLGGACASQAQACRGAPACEALAACLGPCADGACALACWSAHPAGAQQLTPLLDCAAGACPGACPDLPTCLEGQSRCASTNAREVCAGGQWQLGNCHEQCFASGLASAGCQGGACSCIFEPFACEHGQPGCVDAHTRGICAYGQWENPVSCATECAAKGLLDGGCEAGACACDAPCSLGQRRCRDEATLESCDVPPLWSAHPCEVECAAQGKIGMGCVSTAGGTDDCRCVDACGYCLYTACEAQTEACDANPNCAKWDACEWDCYLDFILGGDYSTYLFCVSGCDQAYPGGGPLYQAWLTCANASCASPCGN